MSEGTFRSSSLFGAAGPEPSRDEKKAGKRDARLASVGADPWGAGRDLPSLLQQVSLKGNRRDSGGVFSDDVASAPRRKLNLFSSLRLRKRGESESDRQDQEAQKEIRMILTNLRNKGECGHSKVQSGSFMQPFLIHSFFFLSSLLSTESARFFLQRRRK